MTNFSWSDTPESVAHDLQVGIVSTDKNTFIWDFFQIKKNRIFKTTGKRVACKCKNEAQSR
jgi:hypothetical protein